VHDPHKFDPETLTGRSGRHTRLLPGLDVPVHASVVAPFIALREAAAGEGFDLRPVSGFRDFGRQLAIWNAKCRGQRALLDRDGLPLDAAGLDDRGRVEAILLWSALPGASRHHWGSELDVIDAAALAPGQRPQLVPAEFAPGGPFHRLEGWLARHLADFGFYRPYATDRGGVMPEPWHISHAAVAAAAEAAFTREVLEAALVDAGIDAHDAVRERLPWIFERYVRNVDAPPALALANAAVGVAAGVTPLTRLS
jgi:LAS superfamily LD-carboxypeptidase LdcB